MQTANIPSFYIWVSVAFRVCPSANILKTLSLGYIRHSTPFACLPTLQGRERGQWSAEARSMSLASLSAFARPVVLVPDVARWESA